MSDFELFQNEFIRWQKIFGLTGYKVYFKYELIEDSFADITVNQSDMVATVRLSNEPSELRHESQSAKHEAIHLLLFKLESLAYDRFINRNQVNEEVESLVFKLEDLIQESGV